MCKNAITTINYLNERHEIHTAASTLDICPGIAGKTNTGDGAHTLGILYGFEMEYWQEN